MDNFKIEFTVDQMINKTLVVVCNGDLIDVCDYIYSNQNNDGKEMRIYFFQQAEDAIIFTYLIVVENVEEALAFTQCSGTGFLSKSTLFGNDGINNKKLKQYSENGHDGNINLHSRENQN